MTHFKEEFDNLVKTSLSGGLDRREFIKLTLGTGFAVAVLPVQAQNVITTDTVGLTAGPVTLTVNGQQVPMYRAQPAGGTKLPVVLVVSEIFGVHEHIADVARRFAKQGYLALAPELFVRQGDAHNASSIADLMTNIVAKVPDAQVMGDLDACVAWARENGGDTSRLGITGFCWGGRIAWLYCAHNPAVKAGVVWYGRLVGDKTALTPLQPLDIAYTLKTPVLGLYGAQDSSISQDSIDLMWQTLIHAGNHSMFVVYPDAGHAFYADYRPSYVEADAKDGWRRALAWFKGHGVV